MLTVAELREMLKNLPDDAQVWLSLAASDNNTDEASSTEYFSGSNELWIYGQD